MTTCPECDGEITGGESGTWTTLVGFRSPPGHNHDDNCTKRLYWCANGHQFVLSIRRRCNVLQPDGTRCAWVGKQECFCHAGKKVDAWPVVQYT